MTPLVSDNIEFSRFIQLSLYLFKIPCASIEVGSYKMETIVFFPPIYQKRFFFGYILLPSPAGCVCLCVSLLVLIPSSSKRVDLSRFVYTCSINR